MAGALEPAERANRHRILVLTALTFGVLAAIDWFHWDGDGVSFGWRPRLDSNEASLLLHFVGERDAPVPKAADRTLSRAWFDFAGGMERPSRLLGQGAAVLALLALGAAAAGAGWRAAALLLGAPGFWFGAVTIGGGAAWICVGALGLAAVATWTRAPQVTGRGGVLVAALAAIARPIESWTWSDVVARSGDGLRTLFAPAIDPLTWVAAGAAIAAYLTATLHRRARGKGIDVFLFAAFALGLGFSRDAESRAVATALFLPAAALMLAAAPRGAASRVAVIAAFVAAALGAAAMVHHETCEPRHDTVTADLDWIASRPEVSRHAWVLIHGPERAVWRYYERNGHDTGLNSFVVADAESLSRIAKQIDRLRPPQLVVVGPALTIARYRVDTTLPSSLPQITVLRFSPQSD